MNEENKNDGARDEHTDTLIAEEVLNENLDDTTTLDDLPL